MKPLPPIPSSLWDLLGFVFAVLGTLQLATSLWIDDESLMDDSLQSTLAYFVCSLQAKDAEREAERNPR